jgi:hypothetical protein
MGGADEKMKIIGQNAVDALKRIGAESEINRRRVQRYVVLEEKKQN